MKRTQALFVVMLVVTFVIQAAETFSHKGMQPVKDVKSTSNVDSSEDGAEPTETFRHRGTLPVETVKPTSNVDSSEDGAEPTETFRHRGTKPVETVTSTSNDDSSEDGAEPLATCLEIGDGINDVIIANPNGNVGIGTSSSGYRLQVNAVYDETPVYGYKEVIGSELSGAAVEGRSSTRNFGMLGGELDEGETEPFDSFNFGVYGRVQNAGWGGFGGMFYNTSGNWAALAGDASIGYNYAGHFNGDVNITGDLTVNGTLPGDNLGNHQATTTLDMNNHDITEIKELYVYNWVRHSDNDGTYWSNNNWHINPRDANDMYFRTGSSNGGICGTIANTTPRGYVHWTTGNDIGFLNSSRSWSLRCDNSKHTHLYGNLNFSATNPYISASSYFVAPGGAYFNGGTVYFEATTQHRGGIQNDGGNYNGYVRIHDDLWATGWLRTDGATGWYSQSYGGGWYMTDGTWIRSYGNKPVHISYNGTNYAQLATGTYGVNAYGASYGVYARASESSPAISGGYFSEADNGYYAYVARYSGYKIYGTGSVSKVIPTEDYGSRVFYCPESTEPWLEDQGSYYLKNGHARIDFDPIFIQSTTIDEDHPYIAYVTSTAKCNGLYVIKDENGFDVYELGDGISNASFDWLIKAKDAELPNNDWRMNLDIDGTEECRKNHALGKQLVRYRTTKDIHPDNYRSGDPSLAGEKASAQVSVAPPQCKPSWGNRSENGRKQG